MNATDDPARVQAILDQGANINIRDYKRKTPLHRAAKAGFQKITKLLLESGADIDARDNEGETPLFEAVRHGRLAAARILVEHGASPEILNDKARNVLQVAKRSRKKDAEKIRAILHKALPIR